MARKQEQEPARREITEVAPNVLRMELPIRMPGLGHVNCYALLDDNGAAVVDPGLPGPLSWRALQERLRQAGVQARHVHTVIVTHSHPDHFGGAARLARESHARIVAHRSFRFGTPASVTSDVSVDDLTAPHDAPVNDSPNGDNGGCLHTQEAATVSGIAWSRPTPWGGTPMGPPPWIRLTWRVFRLLSRTPFVPEITQPVRNGDILKLAGREWAVFHTPGHTSDHICLHDPASGILLAGDHVLPTITPHISGLSAAADPLQAFFESLDRVADIQGITQVLPAHGHPFNDLRARTEAIKRHHHERLERVRTISHELGPATVEAFSRRLFRRQSWGAMAESETYAHLEHLRLAKNAERQVDKDGKYLYVTA